MPHCKRKSRDKLISEHLDFGLKTWLLPRFPTNVQVFGKTISITPSGVHYVCLTYNVMRNEREMPSHGKLWNSALKTLLHEGITVLLISVSIFEFFLQTMAEIWKISSILGNSYIQHQPVKNNNLMNYESGFDDSMTFEYSVITW